MWGRTVERRRALGVGLSLGAVCVLLGLHYGVTLHSLGLHDLLRRFFYLPVIAALQPAIGCSITRWNCCCCH